MTRRILCFGDSFTWGWKPHEKVVPVERYGRDERWTGLLASELAGTAEIIEEGLSGRTTTVDDRTDPRLNGAAYLPSALASHLPLDLVVLMLGTNDTKAQFNRSPFDIALGISVLIGQIGKSAGGVGTVYPAPQVLLVAPPPLSDITNPWVAEEFRGGQEKTRAFGKLYGDLAAFLSIPFLDAGTVLTTDGVDGIHFSLDNNRAFAAAVAARLRETSLV